MKKIVSGISSLRNTVSDLYWSAVDTIGPSVPTPQVIGATLAGLIVQGLQVAGIDLSPFGITPGFISVAAAALVAWVIGPERIRLKPGLEGAYSSQFNDPPQLQIVGMSDTPPQAPGEWVNDDDPDAPGTGLVS